MSKPRRDRPVQGSRKSQRRNPLGRWRWLLRLLVPAGLVLLAYLLSNAVDQLNWAEVRSTLSQLSARDISVGVALTLLTYSAASGYELVSRAHERHAAAVGRTWLIGFVAYAVAANLSALLGNWGARYRLYARHGVGFRQTTRIALTSISTNWSGFVLLAGLIFTFAPPTLPARWPVQELGLRAAGLVLLLAALAYLFLCLKAAGRRWQHRALSFTVPRFGIALMQVALSLLVWAGIASVITHFLPAKAEWISVAGVLFLSTVSGLLIRVPAGVGVTEVVFVALLGPVLGSASVIAALLAYRAVFQLLPVLLASTVYLLLELLWRCRSSTAPQAAMANEALP